MGRKRLLQLRVCHIYHMRLELLEQYNNHLKLGDQYHMIHRRIVSRLELEAAKEVNANGMGITKNGMLSHISQMMYKG